jgi:ABC-2 type transport system permease protein
MPAAAPDVTTADTEPVLLRRPATWLSVVLDGGVAVSAYLGSYWLRFYGQPLEPFLPAVWTTLPIMLAAQLLALVGARAYTARPRVDWLISLMAGVVAGTVIGGVLIGITRGFSGLSRSAFLADSILLALGTIGWRGLWVLRARARARAEASATALVDRSVEMTSLKSIVASIYGYRELLKNLVLKDIKLKYRGSVFGFLWSLANPLLMVVVYTFAFTYIIRVKGEGFVFSLMLGLLTWTFFTNSAAMSTGAIIDNSGLLKSVIFPRAILPIGTVLFNLAQYLLTVSVFLPAMMLWYRTPPAWPMLLFPVVLLLQVIFTIGVALILATATAFFRDVRHLLEVLLAMLFWTTPIIYTLDQVPERLRLIILMSPVSPFVVAYQQMFLHRAWPDGTVWLIANVNAFGAFLVGALLFLAFEDRFMEQL